MSQKNDNSTTHSSGVEDGSATLETNIFSTNADGKITFPETTGVDILDSDKSLGVELGLVESTKGDLTVVLQVGDTGNIVRGDRGSDELVLE